MKKKLITTLLLLTMLISPAAYGHRGRTDSSGGHHDYSNASGLGSYHYHHGYGPHLHPGGQCPYQTPPSRQSTSSTTNKQSSAPSSSNASQPSNPSTTNNPNNGNQATIADFPIFLTGVEIKNNAIQYPILSYNNITYIPMTYNMARGLGLETKWDGNALWINQNSNAIYTSDAQGNNTLGQNCTVQKVDFPIYINNQQITQEENYPFLNYKSITYLPLTTTIANKLDLTVQWNDQTGIKISSKHVQLPGALLTTKPIPEIATTSGKTTIYDGSFDNYINLLNQGITVNNADTKIVTKLPKAERFTQSITDGKIMNTCPLTPNVLLIVVTQPDGNIEVTILAMQTTNASKEDIDTYWGYKGFLIALSNLNDKDGSSNKILSEIYVTPGKEGSVEKEYNGLSYMEMYNASNATQQFAIAIPSFYKQ